MDEKDISNLTSDLEKALVACQLGVADPVTPHPIGVARFRFRGAPGLQEGSGAAGVVVLC